VLFNSTFRIVNEDSTPIQMLHGGFKASAWNYLSCIFREIEGACLEFRSFRGVSEAEVHERFDPNPHVLRRTEAEVEQLLREGKIFPELMILGDKESWFFSLPIAPHILYPYVYSKSESEEKEKKLNRAVNIIRSRIGTEKDIEERITKVVGLLEGDTKGDEERKHLELVRLELEDMLKKYASGTLSSQVEGWLEECREKVRIGRRTALLQFFKESGVIPKYVFDKYNKNDINASYLDIAIMHPSKYERRDLGVLAWAFSLALIVLLDSYVEFVKQKASA